MRRSPAAGRCRRWGIRTDVQRLPRTGQRRPPRRCHPPDAAAGAAASRDGPRPGALAGRRGCRRAAAAGAASASGRRTRRSGLRRGSRALSRRGRGGRPARLARDAGPESRARARNRRRRPRAGDRRCPGAARSSGARAGGPARRSGAGDADRADRHRRAGAGEFQRRFMPDAGGRTSFSALAAAWSAWRQDGRSIRPIRRSATGRRPTAIGSCAASPTRSPSTPTAREPIGTREDPDAFRRDLRTRVFNELTSRQTGGVLYASCLKCHQAESVRSAPFGSPGRSSRRTRPLSRLTTFDHADARGGARRRGRLLAVPRRVGGSSRRAGGVKTRGGGPGHGNRSRAEGAVHGLSCARARPIGLSDLSPLSRGEPIGPEGRGLSDASTLPWFQ